MSSRSSYFRGWNVAVGRAFAWHIGPQKSMVYVPVVQPSHPEVEAKSETQGHSESEVSLGYTKEENVHILSVDL